MTSNFGQYLKGLRRKSGIGEIDICAFLNITPAYLCQLENNQVAMGKDLVFKLAAFLNIDVKELLILHQQERILTEIKNIELTEAGLLKGNSSYSNIVRNKRHLNLLKTFSILCKKEISIKTHRPPYPLSKFIECITYCKGHNLDFSYEKILPDGSVQLVIELDNLPRYLVTNNDFRQLKKAWITGIQTQPTTYQAIQSNAIIYIQFHPGGLFGLTGIPQSDLKNVTIDADLVFGPSILELRERIFEYSDVEMVFKILDTYFSDRIEQSGMENEVIEYMCKHISIPFPLLIQKIGYSQKHLIHLFKKHTGITPKNFQRISRFNNSLNQIHSIQGKIDWSSIVFSNQYYDQAHFIKEFSYFSGTNPHRYSETAATCPKFIHSSQER